MDIFENASTWTKQGDIGEARAILEYTKMGYVVSRTIFDSAKYDLIIDNGEKLFRVQVKTTGNKTPAGTWHVELRTNGSNRSGFYHQHREDKHYDLLFILNSENECWSIPTDKIEGKCAILVGKKYCEFRMV